MDSYVSTYRNIVEEFESSKRGYFEIYREKSSLNRKISCCRRELTSMPGENHNVENYLRRLYSAFVCLINKYTQNELISTICIDERINNNLIVSTKTYFDDKKTFQEIMNSVETQSKKFYFNRRDLLQIYKIAGEITGCLFCISDEEIENNCFLAEKYFGDISFNISTIEDKYILNIIFNEEVYNKNFIMRFLEHYENLLNWTNSNEVIPIKNASYLGLNEIKKIVEEWNKTDFVFPREECIHQCFERKVYEDPTAIAVYYEDEYFSREMINKCSNQLAHHLIELGVKNGDIVGVYSHKTVGFVISIMAVLKAGGAYLPIDASYPEARVKYIVDNAKAKFVITTEGNVTECLGERSLNLIDFNKFNFAAYSDENPNVDVSAEDPCYLIYTSGSTGKPKGVLLNHRGRMNNFYDFNSRFSISKSDRVLAVSSVGFDMTAYDILGSMMAGSGIVLPNKTLQKQPFHWLDLISKYKVTVWHSVPVLLELLCKCSLHRINSSVSTIRLVLLGGDWIPVTLPGFFRSINNTAVLISLGGATEVSMDSIIYYINDVNSSWKSIPYGKPMYNQRAYILDQNRELLPVGVPGELYLGGVGVGEGYYLDNETTAQRFFDNKWVKEEKIYKTGDLAYYQEDGTIILLGRMDFQVKINGTRIELGEIEQCLLNLKGLRKAVAVAPRVANTRRIVVYVECDMESNILNEANMIEYLKSYLPHTYIPNRIILLEMIPITPNGKIDRNVLEKKAIEYMGIK